MGQLTVTKIKSLNEPGRYTDGAGLILNVSRTGSKSWILRVQAQGRRRDFGLGSARDVTLAEARDEARRLRRLIRAGVDPLVERRREQARNRS